MLECAEEIMIVVEPELIKAEELAVSSNSGSM